MSWQRAYLPLKSYVIDVDDHVLLAMALSSHIGDDVVEATLVVARCRCRVMLTTMSPSHAGDDAAEMT
jgi:hypothetical protein